MNKECVVVVLCNGMGFMEEIQESSDKRIKGCSYFSGIVTHGCFQASMMKALSDKDFSIDVVHAAKGELHLGPWWGKQAKTNDELNNIFQNEVMPAFQKAGIGALDCSSDIKKRAWIKLCCNSCINPFTGLLQCKNGQLLKAPNWVSFVRTICCEVHALMVSEGILDVSIDDLQQIVLRIANSTGENYSSMYMDISKGQRTEIDYLNGYLARHLSSEISSPNPLLTSLIQMRSALALQQ